jgi:hypothetical protein
MLYYDSLQLLINSYIKSEVLRDDKLWAYELVDINSFFNG